MVGGVYVQRNAKRTCLKVISRKVTHMPIQGAFLEKMGAGKLAKNTPVSVQIVCQSAKVWDFDEKRLHLASIYPGFENTIYVSGLLRKHELK